MFVGRKSELSKLNEMYNSNQFAFGVFYGRRRVGKTTLINKFCEDKNVIYFVGIQSTEKENLESLSRAIFQVTMPGVTMPSFITYEQLFEYIASYKSDKRLIFVIDEYPYLAKASPQVSSLLQAAIDSHFKSSNLFLILCGSSMSFMEHQVLGYQSPLYGRRTAQFKILPFTFFEARKMLVNYTCEEQALLYGVTGGIPEYLSRINPDKSVDDNIIDLFFDTSGRLFEEPSNLLKQELANPSNYNAMISSIAGGATRLNEIATKSGVETSVASSYLSPLIALGLVRKDVPITEKETSRKTIYRLEDQMFRFWYRFISTNLNGIVSGNGEQIYLNKVKPLLDDFMGLVFEDICIDYLNIQLRLEKLPIFYSKIGRWWGNNSIEKRQEEIDILAFDNSNAIFGECKWRNENVSVSTYQTLVKRSNLFDYSEKYFFIFSKTSFTDDCKAIGKSNSNVFLVSFSDMMCGQE